MLEGFSDCMRKRGNHSGEACRSGEREELGLESVEQE